VTALVYHERFLWHDAGSAASIIPAGGMVQPGPNAESPERVARINSLIEVSGLGERLDRMRPREATVDELRRFHTDDYVELVRHISDGGAGRAGQTVGVGPSSFEIAALAVGACLVAVDEVVEGRAPNAYALVRPPGHHALPAEGMGGCIFANEALAVLHARETHGVERVAVVDWDAHHGNGTQAAFADDADVLTISLHQAGCFPSESGRIGEPALANVNVPLPPGSGVGAYEAAFERIVLPAVEAHRPDLLLVASGFDACAWDSHARMLLHSEAYRTLTRMLLAAADRIVLVHEGGYSDAYAPYCALAVLEELSGFSTGVADPFLEIFEGYAYQELQPHQEAVIREAAASLTFAQ
jgi:acetoin utilization deacetylase AcuC-like enzyme